MKCLFFHFLSLLIVFSCSTHQVRNTHLGSKYLRSDWHHWSDPDGNCLDTRAEILKKRSLVAVKMDKRGCRVKSGKWNDYYYPETLLEAKLVDIDHVVPLKHAHGVGAASWGPSEKEKFANDPETLLEAKLVDIDHVVPLKHAHGVGAASWDSLEKEKFANDPENLVITNRSYNRQKGAKRIDQWLPRHRDYACKYVSDWVKIKKKYALRLNDSERSTVEDFRKDCQL